MSRRLALVGALALAGCTTPPVARTASRAASTTASTDLPATTSTASTAPTPADLAVRTTTSAASRSRSFSPAPTAPSRPEPGSGPAGAGGTRTVSSTAYCQAGRTASGEQTHAGGVAANWAPFGSRWRIVATGQVLTVNDRVGHGSAFDIFMPSCPAAISYGRRTIQIEAA